MTVEHSPLSVSDPEEDPQAIVVAKPSSSSSSTIMEPMSMNVNDNDDRDDNDNNGLLVMVQGSKGETQQQPPPYRNTCFAITFVGQLFAVTIVAFAVGVPRLEQLGGAPTIDNDFVRDDDENGFSGGENGSAGMAVVWIMMMMMMMLVVVLALTAIGLSGLFVYIMSRYSASIVKVVLVASPVVFVLFGWIDGVQRRSDSASLCPRVVLHCTRFGPVRVLFVETPFLGLGQPHDGFGGRPCSPRYSVRLASIGSARVRLFHNLVCRRRWCLFLVKTRMREQ